MIINHPYVESPTLILHYKIVKQITIRPLIYRYNKPRIFPNCTNQHNSTEQSTTESTSIPQIPLNSIKKTNNTNSNNNSSDSQETQANIKSEKRIYLFN